MCVCVCMMFQEDIRLLRRFLEFHIQSNLTFLDDYCEDQLTEQVCKKVKDTGLCHEKDSKLYLRCIKTCGFCSKFLIITVSGTLMSALFEFHLILINQKSIKIKRLIGKQNPYTKKEVVRYP